MTDRDRTERLVVELLDGWPWEDDETIIGGYATLAYGPPRYSDDVDIVVPVGASETVQTWLHSQGFSERKRLRPYSQNFEGHKRYESGEVTLDLMIGNVRDRDAKIDVPCDWVARHSRRVRLVTMSTSTQTEVPVAAPTRLWALKLLAGRPQDLSDLFAISPEFVDENAIVELFRSLSTSSMKEKLGKVKVRLAAPTLYLDSLSRRGISPRSEQQSRSWLAFRAKVERVIDRSVAEQVRRG